MNMQKIAPILTACAVAALLAGCAQGGDSVVAPHTANVAADVLQMNVGTANLFGLSTGINVAVTYRQPAGALNPGASAVLVSSPTLTLPHALAGTAGTPDTFGSTIVSGPAPSEVGTVSMTSLSQAPNAAGASTFGNDGGAFGLGLEPFNYVAPLGAAGVTGSPANLVPYPVPLYDALVTGAGGTDPNQFIPGGGPPAFSLAGNTAATLAGFNGVSEGLDVFEVPPAVGTYTLTVNVSTNTVTVPPATATAAISSVAPLPAFVAPVPVLTGTTGGATAAVVLPAGVTEAYIQFTDFGPTVFDGPPDSKGNATQGASCVGASAKAPDYYTVVIKASGTATLPAGSLCSAAQNTTANAGTSTDGDVFTVQAIGFDYGAFEASYPNSLGAPAPSLTGSGASHQADVTVSSQGLYNQPVGGGLTSGAAAALPASAKRAGQSVIRK
jgi:hypothetical protein